MSWGKRDEENPDLSTEPEKIKETSEEGGLNIEDDEKGAGAMAEKLKRIKAESEKCREEKQEYLTGWQRCKADSINYRRESAESARREADRMREEVMNDLIPALDGFDMAMSGDVWAKMDQNWRTGMENVRDLLIDALARHGVLRYGKAGDAFDHALHESQGEMESDGEPGKIARVLRHGYKTADRVLRPAHVAIAAARVEK